MIRIRAIGGYDEVGRNMTLIEYNDEAVICDMGIHVENYIRFTEDEENIENISVKQLMKADVLPDICNIDESTIKKVKGIIPTHAHLDHIGGIPYIAHKFKCPIYAAPYTKEVIRRVIKDERMPLKNKIKTIIPNTSLKISDNIEVEFFPITHSIPQALMLIIKTPEGNVVYANDFKLDNYPTLGQAPNYNKLKKIRNVRAMIIESLYVKDKTKTPPEASVKAMLKDIFSNMKDSKHLIIVTTFSSHIARLKTIVKEAKKLNREIIFAGRSLYKYVRAAQDAGIYDFEHVKLAKYRDQVDRILKRAGRNKNKYLIVCTGHQGEPNSVLSRISRDEYDIDLRNTTIIFSCRTIPTPTNIENRKKLERNLSIKGAHMLFDVHASGHASEEDLKEMLEMIRPEIVIPSHSKFGKEFRKAFSDYSVKLIKNGDIIQI